jgi:L-ascorbate metabolism protein UlaG (beta-lactamase superfamily)
MVVQNEDDVNELKTMGFTDVITFENDELTIGNLSVHRVDCIHGDNEDSAKRMGKTSGYVIKADNEPTLYLVGDTVYFDGVEETINAYNPEVIVVNYCGATTPRGRLIMDDKEAAKQLPLRRIQSSLPATWTM